MEEDTSLIPLLSPSKNTAVPHTLPSGPFLFFYYYYFYFYRIAFSRLVFLKLKFVLSFADVGHEKCANFEFSKKKFKKQKIGTKLWGMISSPRYSPTDEEFYMGFNCLIYDYNDSDRDEFEWER